MDPTPVPVRLLRAAAASLISCGKFLGITSVIGLLAWAYGDYNRLQSFREARLKEYLDMMSALMLDKNLYEADRSRSEKAVWVGRALTLNTLRAFDGTQLPGLGGQMLSDPGKKAAVLKFLYESHLIGFCGDAGVVAASSLDFSKAIEVKPPKISLEDADLQAVNFAQVSRNLCGIDLSRTNLTGAIFDRVDLQNARFANTLANGARFEEARLVGTDLRGAYLIHASFRGAFLSGVIVEGAQLCGADFRQAAGDDFSATAGAPGLQALFSTAYYRGARFDPDLLDAFAGPHRRRHSEGCT